jgi:cytochrome c553
LAGQDPRYLYKQIVDFRTGARASPLMKDYVAALSDQDAVDIAAFYASRKRAASEVKPVSNAATMDLIRIGDGGRMIVACVYCHGDRGAGNPGMYGVPALGGQRGAYLQATLRAFQTGERRNDVYAAMRDSVKRLSQDEIALLASYFSGTQVAPLPPPVAPAQVALAPAATLAVAPDGWYLESQARAGEAAYGSQCASCHGAALGGGMGPPLVGKNFWSQWGGKPFSAIYTEVHARMPMQAPGSVAPPASIAILAYLLQRNGVPPGPKALTDTTDLSRALPSR